MMKKGNIIGLTLIAAGALMALPSCSSIPKNIKAVQPFDIKKYLGRWYEIARFDYRFERGLTNVTADYSINENGSIRVTNRGYAAANEKWKQSIGKAKLASSPDEGMLKVSFFGPFYSGYNVIALDRNYQYALVCGKNREYLWLLSRQQTIPGDIKQQYLQKAKDLEFDTSKLVWVKQDGGN